MLAITSLILDLTQKTGQAFSYLRAWHAERQSQHSEYLESISETCAQAAAAIHQDQNIAKHLAELQYHVEHIADTLRFGENMYQMCVSDDTVIGLRNELEAALLQAELVAIAASTKVTPEQYAERKELEDALFYASGVFRGAAVTLKASGRSPHRE